MHDDGQNGFLEPILSFKWSIFIDTMIEFDGDIDGHGDCMCKQASSRKARVQIITHSDMKCVPVNYKWTRLA